MTQMSRIIVHFFITMSSSIRLNKIYECQLMKDKGMSGPLLKVEGNISSLVSRALTKIVGTCMHNS